MMELERTVIKGDPRKLAIKMIKSLKLTCWGELQLCRYRNDVILTVDKHLRAKSYKPTFDEFCAIADKIMHNRGIAPDWDWVRQLEVAFLMPEDAQFTQDVKPMSAAAQEFANILNGKSS